MRLKHQLWDAHETLTAGRASFISSPPRPFYVRMVVTRETELWAPAKRLLDFARVEAVRLGDRFVGTEHLLLGILSDAECAAFRILKNLGVNERALIAAVESMREPARSQRFADALTFRAQIVIDLAVDEALKRDSQVGSEHFLLAIAREGGGIAARSLADNGVETAGLLLEIDLMEALLPYSPPALAA